MTNTLALTPAIATSAFAVGYCVGWVVMKAVASGSIRLDARAIWRWLLGRPAPDAD
jgi:hypothetical protein